MSTINHRIQELNQEGTRYDTYHPETNTGQVYDFSKSKWLDEVIADIELILSNINNDDNPNIDIDNLSTRLNSAIDSINSIEDIIDIIQSELESKYIKPANGIRLSDLESSIRESLSKADRVSQIEADLVNVLNESKAYTDQKVSTIVPHAGGEGTVASGNYSYAGGYYTTASGDYSYAVGHETTASGYASYAEGGNTLANAHYAHAEGERTEATAYQAHAEGYGTKATAYSAHAEGYETVASGDISHAQGWSTRAVNESAHAEGALTLASGYSSHAEGWTTVASGECSHSRGSYTVANTYLSTAIGRYNKTLTGNATTYSSTGDAFVIGNGSAENNRSNAFRVTFAGAVLARSAYNSTGADYSEYFEWSDGNGNNEDRVGYFVTLEREKIRKANSDDEYVLGITSVNPAIIGDSAQDDWHEKYIRDEWGRIQYEYIDIPAVTREKPSEGEGNTKETIEVIPAKRDYVPKINPNWNPEEEYIPRENRKEWATVGMMGKLLVRDDGTCEVGGYAKSGDDGIATKAKFGEGYRVMSRVSTNTILILVK